jgi:hypothetical protein
LLGNAGTAATYGTNIGSQQTAMLAAQDGAMGAGLSGDAAALGAKAKPYLDAASAAQQAMPPQEETQPAMPQPLVQGDAGRSMQGLLAQSQNVGIQRMQMDEQKRAARRAQLRGR